MSNDARRATSTLSRRTALGGVAVAAAALRLRSRQAAAAQPATEVLALLAPAGTPVAPPRAGETTLLDLTLTDRAPYHAQLGIGVMNFPPGSKGEGLSGTGPQLFYVTEGPIQLAVVQASPPVRVIPPGTTTLEEGKAVAPGQAVRLETGATLVAAAGSTFELRPSGSVTARALWLLSATDSTMNTRDGADWEWSSNGGTVVDLTGPLAIVLRQETVAPDATLPGEASAETHQAVATRDPQRAVDMRTGTHGAVRNAGDAPLEVYVLTVTSAAGTPTPSA